MPSLVSTLLNRELAKGAPLTEAEVLDIRDKCSTTAMPPEVAAEIDKSRGYKDISPENCWLDWQNVREELVEYSRKNR